MPPEVTNTNSKINQDEHAIDCDCKPCVSPTKRMMRYLRVYMYVRIMPFVHSPKGKALVLAVHSRETRNFSRETRLVSRETRRVSRDGGNLHLSGTVNSGTSCH